MKVDVISLKFCINLKSQEMYWQILISVSQNEKFSSNYVFRLCWLALNTLTGQITIFNFLPFGQGFLFQLLPSIIPQVND